MLSQSHSHSLSLYSTLIHFHSLSLWPIFSLLVALVHTYSQLSHFVFHHTLSPCTFSQEPSRSGLPLATHSFFRSFSRSRSRSLPSTSFTIRTTRSWNRLIQRRLFFSHDPFPSCAWITHHHHHHRSPSSLTTPVFLPPTIYLNTAIRYLERRTINPPLAQKLHDTHQLAPEPAPPPTAAQLNLKWRKHRQQWQYKRQFRNGSSQQSCIFLQYSPALRTVTTQPRNNTLWPLPP